MRNRSLKTFIILDNAICWLRGGWNTDRAYISETMLVSLDPIYSSVDLYFDKYSTGEVSSASGAGFLLLLFIAFQLSASISIILLYCCLAFLNFFIIWRVKSRRFWMLSVGSSIWNMVFSQLCRVLLMTGLLSRYVIGVRPQNLVAPHLSSTPGSSQEVLLQHPDLVHESTSWPSSLTKLFLLASTPGTSANICAVARSSCEPVQTPCSPTLQTFHPTPLLFH